MNVYGIVALAVLVGIFLLLLGFVAGVHQGHKLREGPPL